MDSMEDKTEAGTMHIDNVATDERPMAQTASHAQHAHALITRKPVPTHAAVATNPEIHSEPLSQVEPHVNSEKTPVTTSVQPKSRRRSLLSYLPYSARTKWTRLSKRTKILIASGIVILVIFIIGLSAGLAVHHHRVANLPLPSSHGGPYTGDLTYYAPGLGACGVTSTAAQEIVAVSHFVFDAVSKSSNPNANPLCGKKIRIRRNDKSVDVTVVDRCVGCKATDLDVTESVFSDLANIEQGRVTMQWAWLEDVPSNISQAVS